MQRVINHIIQGFTQKRRQRTHFL